MKLVRLPRIILVATVFVMASSSALDAGNDCIFTEFTYHCSSHGSLQGGYVNSPASVHCLSESQPVTLTWTAGGVSDSGYTKARKKHFKNCPSKWDGTTSYSGASPRYSWQITGPQGSSSGSGTKAQITATQPGQYTCRFTVSVTRSCQPAAVILSGQSVTVIRVDGLSADAVDGVACSDEIDNALLYVVTNANDEVSVGVDVSPSVSGGSVPSCWSFGRVAGTRRFKKASPYEGTISRVAPGWAQVEVSCCGEEPCYHAKVVIVSVDLQVDSDNDGTITASDDRVELDDPGKIICVNDDDDDGDDTPDKDQSGTISGENDLSEIRLDYLPEYGLDDGVEIHLEASSGDANIKIWETSAKGTPVDLPKRYTIGSEEPPPSLYIEGIQPGESTLDLILLDPNGQEITRDSAKVTAFNPKLVPDWNRDKKIDSSDENQATASSPHRFWINDDDDDGDISDGDDDLPGHIGGPLGGANYADNDVSGRSDLLDFFPVWLDLKSTLDLLPTADGAEYKLRQDDGALRFVYTDLSKSQAGNYLIAESQVYGGSFNDHAHEANTVEIGSSAVTLSTDFLDKIVADQNKGVLMLEGAGTSTSEEPLVLEVWQNGSKVCEATLPLKISPVENMYRWINLRHITAGSGSETRATDTSVPDNFPDVVSGKQFVFVHGFNSSEEGARAWNAEVFKRLYQSGSRAMYTAVTWEGDETPGVLPAGAYYHADVINAFEAASALASEVAALPGQKYVAAHSLGNMVMSSAIADHGLNPVRYFMIDAAVAMEAYKSSERHPDDIAVSPWPTYTNRVWASEWYSLFDASDGRNDLTWRGRFGNISQAINYFSSGEDVLNNNPSGGSVSLFDAPEHVWVFQEQVKGGILPAILVGVDSHGGWEFNGDYSVGVYDPSNGVYVTATTPAQAAALPPHMLRAHSFFRPFYDADIYGANGSTVAGDADVKGKILAEAMPATSRATGRNDVLGRFSANIDLMDLNTGWPRPSDDWLHSDFKNVAFFYVHSFFEDMVSKGDL